MGLLEPDKERERAASERGEAPGERPLETPADGEGDGALLPLLHRQQEAARERAALLERMRPGLLSRIANRIPPALRGRLDAEDVYQEAFSRALARLEGFEWRGEAAFHGYILTIAQNYIASQQRRHSSDQVRAPGGSEGGPGLDGVPDRGPRASQAFRDADEVDSLLSRLQAPEAEVVRLRTMDGLTFAEVGARVGKSEEAVRKVFNRAVARLLEEREQQRGGASGSSAPEGSPRT